MRHYADPVLHSPSDLGCAQVNTSVAISRARKLVLANPKLLKLDAKSVDRMRFVNTLAREAEKEI